jgi:CheY-like chemotaxis protein
LIKIDFSKVRFLVVDDNAHMRRLVRTLLHGFGCRDVHEAEDGAAGIQAHREFSADVVITDWVMPIMDGIELTRAVRTGPNPYVPVVMLTGFSERSRVLRARDAGVTEFLVKPLSARSLYRRLVSVIANPRPFIETKDYLGPDRRRTGSGNYTGPERRKDAPRPDQLEI